MTPRFWLIMAIIWTGLALGLYALGVSPRLTGTSACVHWAIFLISIPYRKAAR